MIQYCPICEWSIKDSDKSCHTCGFRTDLDSPIAIDSEEYARKAATIANAVADEAYAAGRASMKAEIVKAIEETPRQHHSELGYNGPIGWWTVKTSDLLTRIERTET